MKLLLIATILTLVGSCATMRYSERIEKIKENIVFDDVETIESFAKSITSNELKNHVYTISDDSLEGRAVGEKGHNKAVQYLKNYYIDEEIGSSITNNSYLQEIPKEYFNEDVKSSHNVIAFIEGSDKKEEFVILSAHSDHIGIENGEINNGADDNASGTAAILEIAQAFNLATEAGVKPRRSILFIHLTGEEIGLSGSRYYIDNPLVPLNKTIADLNIDMIGRIDKSHKDNPNYIYIIGSDKLSTELHYISEKANSIFTNLELDYKYNRDNEPNRYFYRSDHYNFAKENIPVIFYFNGEHNDYHRSSDTADKIEYELLAKRTQLIFTTAWYLANSEQKIKIDKVLE